MSHHRQHGAQADITPSLVLMRVAQAVLDRCQRQTAKHRLLENLNLDAIVNSVVCDHGPASDFDQQLHACIDAMTQDDAVGRTWVILREQMALHIRHIATWDLLDTGLDHYEMVLFDGGNKHGDRWKHVFFPPQRMHYFVYEN